MIDYEEHVAYLLGKCIQNLREGKRFSAGVNWIEALTAISNINNAEVRERACKLHYAITLTTLND